MPINKTDHTGVAPPAAIGNAGPQFEVRTGAFYLLSLLAGGEPRGLPGATVKTVQFQRGSSGYPLDDVVISAVNADGSAATLEIQAKRSLTFTNSDKEFTDVVRRMWLAAQKPEFTTTRYELAVAIARTTTRIEQACQEALHWARQLLDGASFMAHLNREKFSSAKMRDFVAVFRANLVAAGAPDDDETVWQLLRAFQILVYDFEAPGSDFDHRAREKARLILAQEDVARAADLWLVLIDYAGAADRAAGAIDHTRLAGELQKVHGFRLAGRIDLRTVNARVAEAAADAVDEIKDSVGGARLARSALVDQAHAALETNRIVHFSGSAGVGKSWLLKRAAPGARILGLNAATGVSCCHFEKRRRSLQSHFVHYTFSCWRCRNNSSKRARHG